MQVRDLKSYLLQLLCGDSGNSSAIAMTSQQLILAQMHALDDVTAVIEDTPDVLCVHCTCEMRVAIVLSISTCCADTLEHATCQCQLQLNHHQLFEPHYLKKSSILWIIN
jgi:hypothetical protein